MVITTLRPKSIGRWAGLMLLLGAFGSTSCAEKPVDPPEKEAVEIFLKEDADGRLVPATPGGKLWPPCSPKECKPELIEEPEIPSADRFSLVLVETKSKEKDEHRGEQKNAAVPTGGLISTARADGGACTVIWVHYPGFGWIAYYNPNDPYCPP